jgi:hypothetical protein
MHILPYFKNSIGQWFIKNDQGDPIGPFSDELALGHALAKLGVPVPASDRNSRWYEEYGKNSG